MWQNTNFFEICVGRFWGILETRDYMRARFRMVDTTVDLWWRR